MHRHALHRPPALLPRLRRRPRQDRARVAARRRGARGGRCPAADPLAPKKPHFAGEGEGASSTCSWPARRASSTCSTTSRSWRSSKASRCRRRSSAASATPSSAPTPPCSARGSSSPSTARAARSSPRCCRTWRRSSTTSAIVKSVHTDQFNHAPAQIFFNTGFSQPGRPSLGSWVALRPRRGDEGPAGVRRHVHRQRASAAARRNWSSGFLPTVYTGVRFRNQGDPILNVSSPPGVDAETAARHARPVGDAEPASGSTRSATRRSPRASPPTRWPSACRPSAPELMDLQEGDRRRRSTCTAATRTSRRSPGRACSPGGWSSAACGSSTSTTKAGTPTRDVAGNLQEQLRRRPTRPAPRWSRTSSSAACSTTRWSSGAASSAARRWSRSNPALGRSLGRDHHPQAFTMWLAGGGIKPGMTLRRDRRPRLPRRRGPRPRPRPAGDDPAPARPRPRDASPTATPAATSA